MRSKKSNLGYARGSGAILILGSTSSTFASSTTASASAIIPHISKRRIKPCDSGAILGRFTFQSSHLCTNGSWFPCGSVASVKIFLHMLHNDRVNGRMIREVGVLGKRQPHLVFLD
jgi:hypothetical protein